VISATNDTSRDRRRNSLGDFVCRLMVGESARQIHKEGLNEAPDNPCDPEGSLCE
jgi:hypothetical protein